MRIVVCVKHVPDADSDRRIEDGRLVRGEDDVLNELDEFAVEAAVSLVEEYGGEVIAVSMGPQDAQDAITRALQMGADKGVLITEESFAGADALGTAAVLSQAVRLLADDAPVDIVFTGMASLDGMTSMVAPAMSALLDWPLLDLAYEVQVEDTEPATVRIVRRADGTVDVLQAATPVVVSVTDQVNEPRYPTFRELRAARKKPVELWTAADFTHADSILDEQTFRLTEVISAQPRERGEGVVVTDSGDGGTALASFLAQAVKE